MITSNPWLMNWVGVSISTQDDADALIPELLKVTASGRFLSVEPLLGPVNLEQPVETDSVSDADWNGCDSPRIPSGISWVIIGGESGHGARPCNVEWIRSIVGQCKDAGVPCFVKQLGKVPVEHQTDEDGCPLGTHNLALTHPKGGDPAEWPEDLRVREFPWGGAN